MKAVSIKPDSEGVEVIQLDDPRIGSPDEVLVRILEVGVCGTDAEICGGEHGEAPEGESYLVPGHEGVGEVVEVGSDVTDLAPGDIVVPSVRRPCAHDRCAACQSGNQDFCITGDYTERGIKGAHGFLAEMIVDEAEYLFRVPRELKDVAVLTEPLTVAEKGLRQYIAIQRRLPWLRDASDTEVLQACHAVVLGGGPIGLLGCLLLRLHDIHTVVYSRGDDSTPEARITREVGAEYVSSESEDFAGVAERLESVELVYEATGAAELMFDVLPDMSANAVFIATGVPDRGGKAKIAAGTVMNELVLSNQVLAGTVNANADDFRSAISHLGNMLERWPDSLRGIITHREGLEDFCNAADSSDGLKHVIAPGGTTSA